MIVGLALDYDVLLISRIMEHRQSGYDVRAATCKAVCETGGTISAAGLIMVLAFSGLLLSDQAIMNACGFILTCAILFDTFCREHCARSRHHLAGRQGGVVPHAHATRESQRPGLRRIPALDFFHA